jgi:hypothetical protein
MVSRAGRTSPVAFVGHPVDRNRRRRSALSSLSSAASDAPFPLERQLSRLKVKITHPESDNASQPQTGERRKQDQRPRRVICLAQIVEP